MTIGTRNRPDGPRGGGTTREGIHLGVMAGTVDLVHRFYAGMRVEHGILVFEPNLPRRLDAVAYEMVFRGAPRTITVAPDAVAGRHHGGVADAVRVRVAGREGRVAPGTEESFGLA